ncbi:hypothetical protein HPY42_04425 [Coprothermobacteraceae bacterium]|nr:hypothetical protein [Coprothermobacteraceae bacterium]
MKVDLSEFSMEELVGLAEKASGKTVLIRTEKPLSVVIFQDRIPVYARYRNVTGDEAYLSSLFISKGTAEITHLPVRVPIRINILKPYEELMSAYEQRRQRYFEYYELLPSLNVKLTLTLEHLSTVTCLHRLEWQILVGAAKGLTVEQTMDHVRTTDYYARLAAVELVTKGMVALADETAPIEPSAVDVAVVETTTIQAAPPQEDTYAVAESEAESAETSTANEIVLKGVAQLGEDFVLGVSILPFTDEFLEASDIDDFTLVLNPKVYQYMVSAMGREFKRTWVSNPHNPEVDPIFCKAVIHPDVPIAAMTVAALFKIRVRDGTWIKVSPEE